MVVAFKNRPYVQQKLQTRAKSIYERIIRYSCKLLDDNLTERQFEYIQGEALKDLFTDLKEKLRRLNYDYGTNHTMEDVKYFIEEDVLKMYNSRN